MIRLVARLPCGARLPALQSIFPAFETDWDASTFPTRERALQGAALADGQGRRAVVYELVCAGTGLVVGRVG